MKRQFQSISPVQAHPPPSSSAKAGDLVLRSASIGNRPRPIPVSENTGLPAFAGNDAVGLAQRGAACVVPIQDAAPDLIRGFGEPKEVAILGVDDPFVDQKSEVDDATPIRFAD